MEKKKQKRKTPTKIQLYSVSVMTSEGEKLWRLDQDIYRLGTLTIKDGRIKVAEIEIN